jgi:hypothetical protein
MMQDLRLAFRAVRRTPVVSTVAALSLALGTATPDRMSRTMLPGEAPSARRMCAAMALAAVGVFAGGLPAVRASRIDPATTLREN